MKVKKAKKMNEFSLYLCNSFKTTIKVIQKEEKER